MHARLSGNDAGQVQIVGITAQQTQKLVKEAGDSGLAELFDVLILDEASQTDVGHAALYATSLAPGASIVLGGDHLQLPPIHEAEAPAGLEAWVGAFIEYLRIVHDIPVTPLLENYRSNETIVGLAHACGYPHALRASTPDLAIRLVPASSKPENWPEHLPWSEAWDTLLAPEAPVSCIVYDDQTAASQWNPFEATIAAALTVRLRERLLAGLNPHAVGANRWDDEEFFSQAVGIVTPHRAQMALIAEKLIQARPSLAAEPDDFEEDWVRSAVDTVERFQGQQRDVIVVSYALGDLDAISDERGVSPQPEPIQRRGIESTRQADRDRRRAGDHAPSFRDRCASQLALAQAVRDVLLRPELRDRAPFKRGRTRSRRDPLGAVAGGLFAATESIGSVPRSCHPKSPSARRAQFGRLLISRLASRTPG